MATGWPQLGYADWSATCDTLHAHTQVLGKFAVALALHAHEALVEHSDGRVRRTALAPDRAVADVTGELLDAVRELAGPVEIDPTPQEVPWNVPLDEDREHTTYDPRQVETYFAAAT